MSYNQKGKKEEKGKKGNGANGAFLFRLFNNEALDYAKISAPKASVEVIKRVGANSKSRKGREGVSE